MHPYPGIWMAIGRTVVYKARAAHAFSAGNKCRHCTLSISAKCLRISNATVFRKNGNPDNSSRTNSPFGKRKNSLDYPPMAFSPRDLHIQSVWWVRNRIGRIGHSSYPFRRVTLK